MARDRHRLGLELQEGRADACLRRGTPAEGRALRFPDVVRMPLLVLFLPVDGFPAKKG